jgi:hypothetical protein
VGKISVASRFGVLGDEDGADRKRRCAFDWFWCDQLPSGSDFSREEVLPRIRWA